MFKNNEIELHIFTNSTINSPSTEHIEKTFDSFRDTFKIDIVPVIWCDPNPNKSKSKSYLKNLKNKFDVVNESTSLSDGYIRAIENSKSEFMFMLEHDWRFERIDNSISEILEVMRAHEIMHLRFNQRSNIVHKSDKYLVEKSSKFFKYCLTPSVSNNPHIINTRLYKEKALPFIQKNEGSYGIEEVLGEIDEIEGCIYGGIDNPKTIVHTDGRSSSIGSVTFFHQVKSFIRHKLNRK